MNPEINPSILQKFMAAVAVASKDPGPVLPLIIDAYNNSEAEDYEYDTKTGNIVIMLHTEESNTAFCCHTDTVSDLAPVNPILDAEKGEVSTNGQFAACLGADCRAGIAVMLYMIENNIPGYYFFFNEEEKGLVGSQAMAKRYSYFPPGVECLIDRMVAFDRKDYNEIITHQAGTRCCSDSFALALAGMLNGVHPGILRYAPSVKGGRTDSWTFRGIVSECCNLSVGYSSPHSKSETQDLIYLSKLAEACCQIDWEDLPVDRDVNVIETLHTGKPKGATKSVGFSPTVPDLTLIPKSDKQEFIRFAEGRLDKFIPTFHDKPEHRRAFVKMMEYAFKKDLDWGAVIDNTLANMVEGASEINGHYTRWLENFGIKMAKEWMAWKYPKKEKAKKKDPAKPQDVVVGDEETTIGYNPALWGN